MPSHMLLGLLLMPLVLSSVVASEGRRTVTVNGQATAQATPDMAIFSTAVVTQGRTTSEALESNNRSAKRIIEALKDNKVAEKDIQTSGLNINPRYSRARGGEVQEIQGYEVSNQVRVIVRDLEQLGTLLDTVVKAGSNQIHGVQFDIQDKKHALLTDARLRAVQDARSRAELYAKACEVSIGDVLSIEEHGTSGPSPRPVNVRMMAAESSVPIAPGEHQIEVTISVTYELVD